MGWHGVFGAASLVFFAFLGFDAVSAAAEEVKNPQRDLPVGIIGSLLLSTVLYIAVSAIVTGMVSWKIFADTGMDSPVSFVLKRVGESWAAGFVDLGAVMGLMTGLLVASYAQSRILFAMSRDGLLPKALSQVHPRFQTPFLTTWVVGLVFGLIGALIPLNVLAELVNIGTLTAFIMVSAAVLVLRATHPQLPRAFRCPGVPVVPILAIISCLFLMIHLQWITWIAFVIWLAIGLVIYFGYSRSHSKLAHSV
jgi:APA family basic amino acid/polyamine antiporter